MAPETEPVPTEFYARTWVITVSAVILSGLAGFALILGPLFLLKIIERADGKPGTEAGIALTIIGTFLAAISALGWYSLFARQRPYIRLGKEGIEIQLIGATCLDGIPLLPTLLRAAWAVVSMQGFKRQTGYILWRYLDDVSVSGVSMVKNLRLDGVIFFSTKKGDATAASVTFQDSEFQDDIGVVAAAIRTYRDAPHLRDQLPSLFNH